MAVAESWAAMRRPPANEIQSAVAGVCAQCLGLWVQVGVLGAMRLARGRGEDPVAFAENTQTLADLPAAADLPPTLGPGEGDAALLAGHGAKRVEPAPIVAAEVEERGQPFVAIDSIPPTLRDRVPARYLAIEESRLVKVVTEWLMYESGRARFTVKGTEQKASVVIAGLSLDLRLDRQDVLEDESSLVVDYKTGVASPDRWATDRPEDVQLSLYASFAVNKVPGTDPGGLVFAKVKAGSMEFAGRLRNPLTVLPTASKTSALVKNPLTDEQLDDWCRTIEGLAVDFLAGLADVNPREPQETCENCKLASLCRIKERREVAA
jgi:hypothetical protein